MKNVWGIILATALLLGLSPAATAQNPVVVELFTSEGCSSCPPADSVLMALSRQGSQSGPPLILLGEHVDYWNYIGWTDRFSSAQFSQRQNDYAKALHGQVYTPQMVIDGRVEFVGNEMGEVRRRIDEAAKQPKPVKVDLRWEGKDLHVSAQPSGDVHGKLLLAITEDGLSTSVGGGENGGRTLHHAAVVRQLRQIGDINGKSVELTVPVAPNSDWNRANLNVAVLAEDPVTQKILGAAEIKFEH